MPCWNQRRRLGTQERSGAAVLRLRRRRDVRRRRFDRPPLEPFAVRVHAPRGTSEDAAAASAAHDVLVHYLPSRAATLDSALATSLALIPDGPNKTDGSRSDRRWLPAGSPCAPGTASRRRWSIRQATARAFGSRFRPIPRRPLIRRPLPSAYG